MIAALPYLYFALSLFMIIVLYVGYKSIPVYSSSSSKASLRTTLYIGIGLLVWFAYLFVLSEFKVLADLSLPPRFPILVFLPMLLFIAVFVRKNKRAAWIQDIPLGWLTYFQSFRILVEIILLYTFYKGLVPESATFEGLNFDQ